MAGKKQVLSGAHLYLVLDTQVAGYDTLLHVLKRAVRTGVDVVQLRDKHGLARDILDFSRRAITVLDGRAPFIMNDRVDLALASGADGVHLGQDDLPVGFARKILGPKKIIGKSCQTPAQARQAEKEGADYIGFGSVFKTLTKPERSPMDLKKLVRADRNAGIPVFAIGGINRRNVDELAARAIRRIAVTRSIILADNVAQTVKMMRQRLVGA